MANLLAQARCFKHVSREAAAKCPSCSRFYCRECVTEHDGRVLCVDCLSATLEPETKAKSGWIRFLGSLIFSSFGFFLTVYAFYMLGRFLLRIPSQFHSGTFFE